MKQNKLTITIHRPVDEVFEFTLNPKNTPLWINSINEEICSEYPPKKGTVYKNRAKNSKWNSYKLIEFEKNVSFIMADLEGNYHVRYTYKGLDDNTTNIEYFEWMENGELENPFTQDILDKLRSVMEKS